MITNHQKETEDKRKCKTFTSQINVKFDLFQLHDEEDDKSSRGWIKFGGEKLLEEVRGILKEIINRYGSLSNVSKIIAKKLNINHIIVETNLRFIKNNKWYVNRKRGISIPLLDALLKLWDIKKYKSEKWKLIELTEFLVSLKSRPVKAVKELTPELCKIAGAHAADGCLSHSKISRYGFTYNWLVSEKDKKAMESLTKWVEDIFGIKIGIKKSEDENAFEISLHNKVFFRYLSKLLGFGSGHKTYTVSMPQIIQNSNSDMRRNFALGVLTFDGCVDVHGYLRMGITSKKLIEDIINILKEDGRDVRYSRPKRGEFTIRVPIKENSFEILNYLDKNSIKYALAKFFVDGSNAGDIMSLFTGNTNNKTNLQNVLKISKKLKIYTISTLRKYIKLSHRTLRAYLQILEKASYLQVIRYGEPIQVLSALGNIDNATAITLKDDFRNQFFSKLLLNRSQKN